MVPRKETARAQKARFENERLERERVEYERLENEQIEAERLAREQEEREQFEAERVQLERENSVLEEQSALQLQENRSRIRFITRRRDDIYSLLEALKSTLDESASASSAKLRMKHLTLQFHEYERLHDELYDLDPDGMNHDNVLCGIREKYFAVAERVESLQGAANPASSGILGSSTNINAPRPPKLEAAPLPIFNGDYKGWKSFCKKFESYIGNRADLDDVARFQYLERCLQDDALAVINGLEPCSEDYAAAWKLLREKYERKRIIILHHIDAILKTPNVETGNVSELSQLLNSIKQSLVSLEQFDVDLGKVMCLRILELALPKNLRQRWQDSLTLDQIPKLEDFYAFVNKTIYNQQSLEDSVTKTNNASSKKRKASVTFNPAKVFKNNNGERTLITGRVITCDCCSRTHPTFRCPEFNALDVQKRQNLVREKRLCYNCLYSHPVPCKSSSRCKTCGGKHHSLLHIAKSNVSAPRKSIVSVKAASVSNNSSATAAPRSQL